MTVFLTVQRGRHDQRTNIGKSSFIYHHFTVLLGFIISFNGFFANAFISPQTFSTSHLTRRKVIHNSCFFANQPLSSQRHIRQHDGVRSNKTGVLFSIKNTNRSSSSSKSNLDQINEQKSKRVYDTTSVTTTPTGMEDLVNYLETENGDDRLTSSNSQMITISIVSSVVLIVALLLSTNNQLSFTSTVTNQISDIMTWIDQLKANPDTALQNVVQQVKEMGPIGMLYFGFVYTLVDLLAIPAFPLTTSAGYLFGFQYGTLIVLTSASIAAAISFGIGRTFLRSYVEKILDDMPQFKKLDKAIGKEGFKLILLLRLSPIFPFALSNYVYGVTRIKFWPYFWGTMIGFAPGTLAYVYTGEIGKALTLNSSSSTGDLSEPWYVYAIGLALFIGFLKIASDVATGIIRKLEEEHEN